MEPIHNLNQSNDPKVCYQGAAKSFAAQPKEVGALNKYILNSVAAEKEKITKEYTELKAKVRDLTAEVRLAYAASIGAKVLTFAAAFMAGLITAGLIITAIAVVCLAMIVFPCVALGVPENVSRMLFWGGGIVASLGIRLAMEKNDDKINAFTRKMFLPLTTWVDGKAREYRDKKQLLDSHIKRCSQDDSEVQAARETWDAQKDRWETLTGFLTKTSSNFHDLPTDLQKAILTQV
jgi:hypothetical protein